MKIVLSWIACLSMLIACSGMDEFGEGGYYRPKNRPTTTVEEDAGAGGNNAIGGASGADEEGTGGSVPFNAPDAGNAGTSLGGATQVILL